jgi:hypothetical protein
MSSLIAAPFASLSRASFTGAVALLLGVVLGGCSSGDGGSGSSSKDNSCASVCKRIDAPHCPGAEPDCEAACEDQTAETPDECKTQLNALKSCFASAKFTCDEDGMPTADGCKNQLSSWSKCVAANVDTDTPAACSADPEDDECAACAKAQCCTELNACATNDGCTSAFDCVNACADDACVSDCLTASSNAEQAITAIVDCTQAKCAACQ